MTKDDLHVSLQDALSMLVGIALRSGLDVDNVIGVTTATVAGMCIALHPQGAHYALAAVLLKATDYNEGPAKKLVEEMSRAFHQAEKAEEAAGLAVLADRKCSIR